eukprot:NODE_12_length_45166_cov_0.552511.p6 type:complete len:565 gc:universal NODE_12_length_45166_cov_0.552511:27322-25628(-)
MLKERLEKWDRYAHRYRDKLSSKSNENIKVTLPDGKEIDGLSWKTTPYEIAKDISTSLANRVLVARLNKNDLWDLHRPLETSCNLELLDFSSQEGKMVFWHSSAHVLGESMEQKMEALLGFGPPLEDGGFFYEATLKNKITNEHDRVVSPEDYHELEAQIDEITKEKQPFERLFLTKAELLDMFKYNKYKVELIESKITAEGSTVYRCGELIDLCRGPHVPDTGYIKALMLTKNSAAYWLGKKENDTLQRIYGISFPSKKELKQHKKFLEEAAKRDHRKLGKEMELVMFHEYSPGSAFFLPHGTRVYNKLVDYMKEQYRKRGFHEVITPNMYNTRLWETSGHWMNYQENMFSFDVEKEKFALKPMNCPGHCLMFKNRDRSYRELPLRLADFGVLHRNEFSGALSGLTRVRRFCQDDAHIFCTINQIKQEMLGCLDFLKEVYGVFGFKFDLRLSTRPEKYLGEVETWNEAEKLLQSALDEFGNPWTINEGDGAFYGPKIDITVKDALNRSHQCATIQLDFQLPQRFGLEYRSETGLDRPVMIHRAILGSVERMFAVLLEHYAGKW